MEEIVSIGFVDEMPSFQENENDEEEKSLHGRHYKTEKKKTVYLPPEREKLILDDFDCVVAYDYGDDYHLSEEEREKRNKYYKAFKVLRKAKRNYRKLDEYVSVMRDALKCLDIVAESNGIYDPDKFKKMYFRNKIYITGLVLPNYKGKNRKEISWEYISEFILSDKDPKELVNRHRENMHPDETDEERVRRLFTKEERMKLLRIRTKKEQQLQDMVFDTDFDDPEKSGIAVYNSNSDTKKVIKAFPELVTTLRDIKRDLKKDQALKSYAYELTEDDMDYIKEYDRTHNIGSSSEMPEFNGNILDGDDYDKYMRKLEDWENTHIKVNYNGRMKTLEEVRELDVKADLERAGWNIRNLYNNKEREKKLERMRKRDKEKVKKLKNQLVKAENRKKRRMNEDESFNKKKSKKKSKDKKKKKESD